MTACGAIGALMVGGRVVGQLRCELDAGHEISVGRLDNVDSLKLARERIAAGQPFAATPHRVTLTWTPERDPDLDLFDPDESFDVDVEL